MAELDKIETDCEKVNLKNRGPTFFKFESVPSKTSGKEQNKATKSSTFAI